jgi:broad specificity phosphatase PhoE
MQLYISRHGQSCGNTKTQDGPDPELTEIGFAQARLLGERLSGLKLDCIISSPLIRALATAQEVAVRQPGGPAPVELLPDMMETGTASDYTGLAFDELKKICKTAVRCEVPTPAGGGACLGFEDDMISLSRAFRVIGYVRRRFRGDENVLLVAHGSFNTRLVTAALRLSLPDHFNYSHDNTGLTLVKYINENGYIHTKLAYLNDVSHLYRHDLSERI